MQGLEIRGVGRAGRWGEEGTGGETEMGSNSKQMERGGGAGETRRKPAESQAAWSGAPSHSLGRSPWERRRQGLRSTLTLFCSVCHLQSFPGLCWTPRS